MSKIKRYLKKGILSTHSYASSKSGIVKKIAIFLILIIILVPAVIYGKNRFIAYVKDTVVVSEGEIIRKVSLKTELNDEEPLSIVRVQDAETLRKQQEFYKGVKEGDYILMFPSKVIVYNLREDKIVAEKTLR